MKMEKLKLHLIFTNESMQNGFQDLQDDNYCILIKPYMQHLINGLLKERI